jgi:hypothetical protein
LSAPFAELVAASDDVGDCDLDSIALALRVAATVFSLRVAEFVIDELATRTVAAAVDVGVEERADEADGEKVEKRAE